MVAACRDGDWLFGKPNPLPDSWDELQNGQWVFTTDEFMERFNAFQRRHECREITHDEAISWLVREQCWAFDLLHRAAVHNGHATALLVNAPKRSTEWFWYLRPESSSECIAQRGPRGRAQWQSEWTPFGNRKWIEPSFAPYRGPAVTGARVIQPEDIGVDD